MAKDEKFRGNKRNNRNSRRRDDSSKKDSRGYKSKEAKYTKEANEGNTPASNHVEWYGGKSVLIDQAANLPFFETAGLPFNLGNLIGGSNAGNNVNPGIMNLYMITTPGTCEDWSSPVNVAIRDMYSFIRHQNSGSKNYEAANLGMYLMAYDSCATYYAWMVRTYGISRMIMLRNRYTPEILANASGIDYASIIQNLAQFAAYINTFAARMSAMRVPSEFHVFERHMWIYSNVFADAPVEKAQLYMFQPYRFWKYTLGSTSETTGMFLAQPGSISTQNRTFRCTFNDVVSFGEELLNSILNDEDFNIMSGDILKAYGEKTFTLSMISPEYSVAPVYDPEVLMQIHNATVFETRGFTTSYGYIDVDKWSITEDYSHSDDVGALVFNADLTPDRGGVRPYVYLNKVLDVPVMNPSPEIVCLATRLMTQANFDDNGDVHFTSYGTEIIVGADVIKATPGDPNSQYLAEEFTSEFPQTNRELFANRPYVVYQRSSVMVPFGPFDNYTVVDGATLYNIHRAALLGMYGFAK